VRLVTIHQLVKLTKHAGPPLRPFIPDLAVVLLESLSSLEPQMNTYLQVLSPIPETLILPTFPFPMPRAPLPMGRLGCDCPLLSPPPPCSSTRTKSG
jgi:hypothetical protein